MGTSPLLLALYTASAGGSTPLTMHHITSCTQCGRAWCASARRVPPQWTVFSWDDQHLRGSPVCGPSTPKGACVPCDALPCGAIPHTPTSHEGVLYAPTNASLPPPSPPCHPPPLPPPSPPPPPTPPPRPTPLLRPSWAPTYSMNRSTYTGYLDLNYSGLANSTVLGAASRYGLVTVSWNQDICHNARVSSPRSACAFAHADGSLRAQAARIRALSPTTRVLLYRNCALGMSTYGEQCRKMYDPAFARWWLRSHDSKTGPVLNSGIDPTKGDGDNGQRGSICPGPPAQRKQDQYLLDFRNASARQFLVDDLKGLVAGGADGIWLDDTHAFNEHKDEEAGYSAAAIAAIGSGLKSAAEQAMRELVAAGKWVYHFEDSGQMQVLESGDAGACTRALLSNNASGATTNMFQVMQLPLFNASEVPAHGGQTVAHMFQQNLANFLMTRGAYSFMSVCGSGDCYIRPDGKGAGSMPPWFPEWDLDYGVPLGGMRRTTSGNFARNWSKCTVSLDCNQLKATFDWRRRPLPLPARVAQKNDDRTGGIHPASRHRGIWSRPPVKTPSDYTIDGPIVGGGGTGVAVGGGHSGVPAVLYIGHNSFWSSNPGEFVFDNPYTMISLASVTVRVANESRSEDLTVSATASRILSACDPGAASQRWYFLQPPQGDAQTGQLLTSQQGSASGATCMDVADAQTAVVFDGCNAHDTTPNQNWLLINETQQLFSTLSGTRFGKWPRECAEAATDGTVSLRACNASIAAQRWKYNIVTRQLETTNHRCVDRAPAPPPGLSYHAEQDLATATVSVQTDFINMTLRAMPNASRPGIALLQLTNTGHAARKLALQLATTTTYGLPALAGVSPATARASPTAWVSRNGVRDTDNPLTVTTCVYGGQQSWTQLFAVGPDGALTLSRLNRNAYEPTLPRCLRRRSDDGLATVAPCNGSVEQAWVLTGTAESQRVRHTSLVSSCLTVTLPSKKVEATEAACAANTSEFAAWSRFKDAGSTPSSFRLVNHRTGKCLTVNEPSPQVFGAVGLTAVDNYELTNLNSSTDGNLSSEVSVTLAADGGSAEFVLTVAVLDGFKGHSQEDTLHLAVDTGQQLAGAAVAVEQLHVQHSEWWENFWNRSMVDLGPDYHALEGFYYGMQYMLASGTAGSEVPPGLWGPWITTDHPGWTGDFTSDYNFEMPFQSVASENRPELMLPYFDIVELHTPLARWRGTMKVWGAGSIGLHGIYEGSFAGWCDAVRGCAANFSGWEWPSHVSRFAGLYHGTDSGLRSIGAFLVSNFITFVDYTADWQFMEARAYPLLLHVADFYESYATWDTMRNQFNILRSCAQEVCSAQGGNQPWPGTAGNASASSNPPYDIALAKRVLRRLLAWSMRLGRDADRRQSWQFMLDHLAPWELTLDDQNRTVFAQASLAGHPSGGFPRRTGPHPGVFNSRYPIVYLAAIYPGEEVGPDSDAETLAIARRTVEAVNSFNDWSPTNGMCMAWPPATRVLQNASFLLNRFEYAVNLTMKPNFFPDINNHPSAGSGCPFENAGSLLAINELMLMSSNFTLRFFPAGWPAGQRAVFSNLRAKGAFLASGTAVGGKFVGAGVRIKSEAGTQCTFVPPQFSGGSGVQVTEESTGTRVPLRALPNTGGKMVFATEAGATYLVSHLLST